MKWIQLIVRLCMAGLFIYAGVVKLMRPDLFLSDVESYRMMPYHWAWLTVFYLPPLEILCGLGLILPSTQRAAASLLTALMAVFILAISVAWARGLNISCGCFGESTSETNFIWLIARDLLIIGALLFILFIPQKQNENT